MTLQAGGDVRELLNGLGTDQHAGLSEEEAQERLRRYGPNEIREKARKSPLSMLAEQFLGVMSLLLIVAGVISAATGDLKDAVVITAIVVLNAVMGFFQEYRAEKALSALKKLAVPAARVVRSGRLMDVPSPSLVPGDLVRIQAGDIMPADGRLIETANLHMEEAALTGESVPVEKSALHVRDEGAPLGDRKGDVFMGTVATQGRGSFIVTHTGMNTQLGDIARMIDASPEKQTPLQRRLAHLGVWLAAGAVAICLIVMVAGILQGRDTQEMLLTAISLAVAAVPEALPAVVTISLALGAQRMVKRHALIRKLPAVETLGCVTAICSDKTGTLTQNRMTVESLFAGGRLYRRAAEGFTAPEGGDLVAADVDAFLRAVSLCNDGVLQRAEDGSVSVVGDPTETSLLLAAHHGGLSHRDAEEALPRIDEVPFDSTRKRMTTLHRAHDGTVHAFTKGAIDVILPRCAWELVGGERRPLDGARAAHVLAQSEAAAARGARVIAAGWRAFEQAPDARDADAVENALTFVGFAAILDPPRPEAAAAVERCRDAGITVTMITGDHRATAAAIGADLGILPEGGAVATGQTLDEADGPGLAGTVEQCRVYARVAPDHKVRIVEALKERGHIVAMTGDGVNDAPSLRRADIGVAMGITGTDVSREAADMVLTDDNFATIVAAVEEGRTIYDNVRKFVRYTLATNFGEVLTMFVGMLMGFPLPLLPIQILWINLVTDGLPALALGMEPPEGDVMRRPPRDPRESIFARGLLTHILWVGAFMAVGTLAIFASAIHSHGVEYARTMAFMTLASFQLFHVLAIRRERLSAFRSRLTENRFLVWAVLGTFAAQAAITYVGPLAGVFKNVPIDLADLLLCVGVSSSIFLAVELEKALRRRQGE